jgi:hypothetical protein
VFRADSASGAYRIVANQTGVNMQGTVSVAGKITASVTDSEFYNRLFIKNGTHGLYMGQWDTVNHRIEGDANRPISIQSYHTGTGILLGNSGNTKLQVHASGISVTGTATSSGDITTSANLKASQIRVMEGNSLAGGLFKEKNVTGTGSSNDLTFFAESISDGGDIHFMTGGATTKQLSISSTGEILMSGGSLAIAANAPGDSLVLMSNEVVVNQNSLDLDFRVESNENANMLKVDAGANSVRVGTANTGLSASLEIQNIDNKSAISQISATNISGSSQYARYAEGVEAYNTTSSGTILTIPITDQANLWRQYIVEFMFCSGEYNRHDNAKAGTLKVGFTSLNNGPAVIAELEKTGNVASVSGNDSNLLITFTTGYTSGLNDYEGVICHYRVLGYSPEYLQMWNGTLN